jgi:hypothetical protein
MEINFNPKKLINEECIKFDTNINTKILSRKENFNHILFIGDSKDKLIFKYNLETDEWSTMECSSYGNAFDFLDYSASATLSNGEIIITGGCHYTNYRNTAQKSTFIAKIISNSAHVIPFKPMIVDRFSHGCLVIKDIPYVFGGHDGNETLNSLECYDSVEGKWKFLSFMNVEREIFAYCSVKQRYIFVFGGFNINHLDSIERYDVVYDKWKLLNYKMKRPLQNATAVELDSNRIVLIGGYNGALHKCVDILDLENKNWVSLDYMQVPRRKSHSYKYKNKVNFKQLILDFYFWRRILRI